MPLILPSQTVIRPNPLAYPAGAVPGIDPSHPASKGCLLSAIPTGANFVNLVTGTSLVNLPGGGVVAPTSTVAALVGPAVVLSASSMSLGISIAATVSGYTIGTILGPYSGPGGSNYQALVFTNDTSFGFWLKGGTPVFETNVEHLSGLSSLVVGHSYFVAGSTQTASGSALNFLVKNLATGAVFTASTTQTNAGGMGSVTDIGIAQDKFNEFAGFPYAAGMFSNTYLNPQQLRAWAADPWSFWYPNKRTNLVNSAGAAATFLAAWARGSNLPVLGTGTY